MKTVFWCAVAFVLLMALLPGSSRMAGAIGPFFTHVFAFAFLAIAFAIAYPRARMPLLGSILALLGGLIEFAQMIPALGRQASLKDWLADIIGLSVALLALHLWRHYIRKE